MTRKGEEVSITRSKCLGVSRMVLLPILLFLVASAAVTQTVTRSKKPSRCLDVVCTAPAGGRVVTVLFKGLFFFSFPNGTPGSDYRSEGQVGVLSSRQDHNLYLRYFEGATEKTLIFQHSALQSLSQDIEITKANPPGVKIHGYTATKGWGAPNKRMDASGAYDCAKNFSWIIDFEGNELHKQDIQLKPNTLRPILHFKVGTFYTHYLSDYPFYVVQNGSIREFGYAAAVVGVCIELGSTEHLTMRIGNTEIGIPDDISKIELYNVRPEDWPPAKEIVAKSFARRTMKQHGVAPLEPRGVVNHSDEISIFYDDLLDIQDQKMRFHFIPIMKAVSKSEPFVCYGGGGSIWP